MFVVFDGIDGCGKTRQADLFQAHCQAAGLTTTINRDPGGSPAGSKIRAILLDKSIPLDPVSQALLFAASRNELYKLIKEQSRTNKVVISDRWVTTSLAYQCHALGVSRELVMDLYDRTVGVHPDIYVIIDIDAETALARKENRPPPLGACGAPACKNRRSDAPGRRAADQEVDFAKKDDRFESMGTTVQEKMRQGFLNEVQLLRGVRSPVGHSHFIVVDGSYSPDVLAGMIREEISKLGPSYERMLSIPAAA